MSNLHFGIALSLVPGIGNVLYKRLIAYFKRAELVFNASVQELKKVEGIGNNIASAIKDFNPNIRVKETLLAAERNHAHILTLEDEKYPRNLIDINDPPSLLYVKGQIRTIDQYAMAVVGSRLPSKYGEVTAGSISRDLATDAITVVSGMARGIDSISHKAALHAGGRTIAVLGSGIDVVYPPENRRLFDDITRNGAVITELPISTPPNGTNFPDRNRIISGLSLGVVIVEAGIKSGSLITAKFAAIQGRKVFSVPGQIDAKGSKGTNRLIKGGATLVENAAEVVDVVLPQYRHRRAAKREAGREEMLSKNAKLVLATLTEGPLHIDTVAVKSRLDISEVSSILLNLELSSLITHLPGKIFIRNQ